MLYNAPPDGIEDYAIKLDRPTFNNLYKEVPGWDINCYLPQETQEWCTATLREIGFDPFQARMDYALQRERPFQAIYLQLRSRLVKVIAEGCVDISLCPHPTGNFNWQVSTCCLYMLYKLNKLASTSRPCFYASC
jgi:hypothetical protein